MSTNVHVLHAFSPLCDVNAQCSNIRGSFIAADANLIHISGNGKTCKGLWSVESRDSSVVSSQKGVTLLCEFSLLGNKVFLLRSNSTCNLIQKTKNQLQYAKRSVSVDAITVSILAIPVNLARWNMSRSRFCVVNFHCGKTIPRLCCLFSDINECTDYSPS